MTYLRMIRFLAAACLLTAACIDEDELAEETIQRELIAGLPKELSVLGPVVLPTTGTGTCQEYRVVATTGWSNLPSPAAYNLTVALDTDATCELHRNDTCTDPFVATTKNHASLSIASGTAETRFYTKCSTAKIVTLVPKVLNNGGAEVLHHPLAVEAYWSSGREWYAAPNGAPTAAGTSSSPWNLEYALAGARKTTGEHRILPGDKLVLLPGTYLPRATRSPINILGRAPSGREYEAQSPPTTPSDPPFFISELRGEPGKPIIVAGPSQAVIIDRNGPLRFVRQLVFDPAVDEAQRAEKWPSVDALATTYYEEDPADQKLYYYYRKAHPGILIHGAHTWFRDLEITNSMEHRVTAIPFDGPEYARDTAIHLESCDHIKLINLVTRDSGNGYSAFASATNVEIYGGISYNNGWIARDRGQGHGLYLQNDPGGTKSVVDMVMFANLATGLKAYSDEGQVSDVTIEGNISFNNSAHWPRDGWPVNGIKEEQLGLGESFFVDHPGNRFVQLKYPNVRFTGTDERTWITAEGKGSGQTGDPHEYGYQRHPNIFVGSKKNQAAADNITIKHNLLWHPPMVAPFEGGNLTLGFRAMPNKDVHVVENYVAGSVVPLSLKHWENVEVRGNILYAGRSQVSAPFNSVQPHQLVSFCALRYVPQCNTEVCPTYYFDPRQSSWDGNVYFDDISLPEGDRKPFGVTASSIGCAARFVSEAFNPLEGTFKTGVFSFADWLASSGFDAHSKYGKVKPSGIQVYVRPNRYQPGRANIAIYNWDNAPYVDVDLTAAGLRKGQQYVLRDAQDLRGPIIGFTHQGGTVSIPMLRSSVSPPVGAAGMPNKAGHTPMELGVWIVAPHGG